MNFGVVINFIDAVRINLGFICGFLILVASKMLCQKRASDQYDAAHALSECAEQQQEALRLPLVIDVAVVHSEPILHQQVS